MRPFADYAALADYPGSPRPEADAPLAAVGPAAIWAVYALSRYKTDQKIDAFRREPFR